MKRLLEMISLVFCALLMSCSNGISDKTGDINFSLNVEDALRAASLDRATDGSENTANSEKEYIFLVQVKGSRNYYDYQIQTVRVENNTSANAGQSNPQQTGNSFIVSDPYGDYIKDNELSFTFGYVPANQKYTVMFDMFEKAPVYGQSQTQYQTTLVLSGHSQDIQVHRGTQSGVEVDIANLELSPISLAVEYENDNSENFTTKAFNAPVNPPMIPIPQIAKKYGKLWYSAGYGQTYNPIKSIGYALDSNSNFPESSYKYSIPYGMDNGNGIIDDPNYITFDVDRYSLYDFLSGYKFPESDVGTLNGSSETLMIDSPAKITKTGSKGNISFIENAPTFNFKSEDEVASGSMSNIPFQFSRNTEDNTKYDFVCNQDLYTLLGYPQSSYVIQGKQMVLVLNMKGGNPNPNNTQLYYKIQCDETTPIYSYDDIREGNHCINLKPGETKYIIPLCIPAGDQANVPNAWLTLFMEADAGSPENLNYTFDVDYYIFPNNMAPFIFNIKYNDNRYRYEMDEYLHERMGDINFSEGGNVKNTIRGVFCLFSLKDKKFIPISTQLTSELWYWDPNKLSNPYTTISRARQTFTTDTDFEYDNDNASEGSQKHYDFTFYDIGNLDPEFTNSYKILCYADCQDTNYLLIARDFGLDIVFQPQ